MEKLRPSDIYFTQDSIGSTFGRRTRHNRQQIGLTLDDLVEGRCRIDDIPTICVKKENGKWWTADNRRLWIFRYLEKLGKCSTINVNVVSIIDSKKRTTTNGGVDVRIYKGRDPGGIHWQKVKSINNQDKSTDSKIENVKKTEPLNIVPNSITQTLNCRSYASFEEVFGFTRKTIQTTHKEGHMTQTTHTERKMTETTNTKGKMIQTAYTEGKMVQTSHAISTLHKVQHSGLRSEKMKKSTSVKTRLKRRVPFMSDVYPKSIQTTKLERFCFPSYPQFTFISRYSFYPHLIFHRENYTFVESKIRTIQGQGDENDISNTDDDTELEYLDSPESLDYLEMDELETCDSSSDKMSDSETSDDETFIYSNKSKRKKKISEAYRFEELWCNKGKSVHVKSTSKGNNKESKISYKTESNYSDNDHISLYEEYKYQEYDDELGTLIVSSSEPDIYTLTDDEDCEFDNYESDSSMEETVDYDMEIRTKIFTSVEFDFDSESSDNEEDYRTASLDRMYSEGLYDSDSDNMIFDYLE